MMMLSVESSSSESAADDVDVADGGADFSTGRYSSVNALSASRPHYTPTGTSTIAVGQRAKKSKEGGGGGGGSA